MEMQFAIGPCNFSNLKRHDAPSEPNLSRALFSCRECVTICDGENALNFYKALFVARGSTRSRVRCTCYLRCSST